MISLILAAALAVMSDAKADTLAHTRWGASGATVKATAPATDDWKPGDPSVLWYEVGYRPAGCPVWVTQGKSTKSWDAAFAAVTVKPCPAIYTTPPPPVLEAAGFYIDAIAGSDANSGASRLAPWKHAPGMPGASGVAALTALKAGDHIFFKGGVTWNHTNFEWHLDFKGTAEKPIYLGADPTWFSGSVWTRPIFNAEHLPLATGGVLVSIGDYAEPHIDNYVTLDNIELRGADVGFGAWATIIHACATHFVMSNLFVHDWISDPSQIRDDAYGGIIGNYPRCRPTGNVFTHGVISNTEARDAGRQNGIAIRATDVEFSTIHDVQTAQLFGLVRDSEYYNVSYPQLGRSVVGSNEGYDPLPYHENVTYVQGWDGAELPEIRPGLIYNNYFHHIAAGSGAIYPNACPLTPFVIFNNVVDENYGNQAVQIDQYFGAGTCGVYHIWNNIFRVPASKIIGPIRQVGRGITIAILDVQNNRFIHDNGPDVELDPGAAQYISLNNVSQTNAQASAQGYVPTPPKSLPIPAVLQ